MDAVPDPVPDQSVLDEYRAARDAVALVDHPDLGVVEVTGRDRAKFLHALLSNDVAALAPGQGCAATLLDIHGKIQAVLSVLAFGERILLVTPPAMAAKLVEALDHYLFAEKVVLRDASEETALFRLAGPQAPATAERLAGALADAATSLVRGGGETGGPEVWVAAARSAAARVREALVAAGARPLGAAALESLRIEAGTPRFGEDVDGTVLLPEIASEHLVSHTKGCYPGQEVVVRVRDRGHVNRHLRGLVLEGDVVPPRGAEVVAGDAVVGQVTSATRSLGLGRPIALAFLRRQVEPGARVEVRAGAAALPATVSDLPFAR